jgi:hypothetical protein
MDMEYKESAAPPKIHIFCTGIRANLPPAECFSEIRIEEKIESDSRSALGGDAEIRLAEEVGHGIEEEGLSYQIEIGSYEREAVWDASRSSELGVSILVKAGEITVYCRQLKGMSPLFQHESLTLVDARIVGKNAARIVKNKPFSELVQRI